MTEVRKAYGYIRVSTEEQAKEGLSLEAQKTKIRAFAEIKDLELVDIIADEGISGKDFKQPVTKPPGTNHSLSAKCARRLSNRTTILPLLFISLAWERFAGPV